MRKVAFLDRDGVINHDTGYISKWDDFKIFDGVISALSSLVEGGYELVIITNQSGIARGLFTNSEYQNLTQTMKEFFLKHKITFLDIYHCPHHPDGNIPSTSIECDCRKPRPGMILNAAKKYDIDLNSSILIGDKISDIECGKNAGIKKNYLITSKYHNLPAYENLKEIVNEVLKG